MFARGCQVSLVRGYLAEIVRAPKDVEISPMRIWNAAGYYTYKSQRDALKMGDIYTVLGLHPFHHSYNKSNSVYHILWIVIWHDQ